MKKVAIVNYGMGNLDSVLRAFEECGADAAITDRPADLDAAHAVVLPGVGAFADGMRHLRERGLDEALQRAVIERGAPCLGLCLGMQLMATHGEEGGDTAGLGWIPAEVRRLKPDAATTRIPHVGWNEVHFVQDAPLFHAVPTGADFYFVHSYHMLCANPEHVLARTPYCGEFASVVGCNNVYGVQFHPEKSQRLGLKLITNFVGL